MGSIFKPKMPPLPPVQAPPPIPEPTISAEEKEQIAKDRAAVERKRRGRKSTILTRSLTPEAEEEIEKKTLLGDN
jgi:hypothetical protein